MTTDRYAALRDELRAAAFENRIPLSLSNTMGEYLLLISKTRVETLLQCRKLDDDTRGATQ